MAESMRPGTTSLRDIQPITSNVWVDVAERLGLKDTSFNPARESHSMQLKAIQQGIISGQYSDDEINEYSKLYPEAAPFVSQAVRQRDILKANLQGENPSLGGAVNSAVNQGELQFAKNLATFVPDAGDTPSAIKEWKFYNGLSKQDQARFLELKRQGYRIADIGGVPSMAPTVTGLPVVPLSTLGQEVSGKAAIEGGKKAAEVKAGATAQAEVDLGGNLDEINKMREGVGGLLDSDAFEDIYGLKRPLAYIPNTAAAGAEARRAQLEAASFGISIQKMRGLGQLSDAEGRKVTAAYTRAINTRQSPEDARKAWNEVLGYLDKAEQRAYEKAGKTAPKPSAQPTTSKKRVKFSELP